MRQVTRGAWLDRGGRRRHGTGDKAPMPRNPDITRGSSRSTRRVRRTAVALVLGLTAIFGLSGCLKLDMQLTVAGDSVSGTMILAIDKQLLALTGQSEQAFLDQMTSGNPLEGEGVTSQRYDDGSFVGTKFLLDNVPLSQLNQDSGDNDTLKITHDAAAGVYRLTGVMDLTSVDSENPLTQNLAKNFDITLAVTFPGTVTKHNGELSGTTVTWRPKPGERTVLEAEARESSPFPWGPTLAIGIPTLLVLLGVAGAIVWLISRRRPTPNAPAPTPTVEFPTGEYPQ